MTDFHLHTVYCDGKNTPEEMVLAAIDKGMESIGVCCHGYTDFDLRYCIKKEKIADFIAEVNALKIKYSDKIKVLCGVEQDAFSDTPTDGFDYVVASAHYLKNGDVYTPIDEDINWLTDAVERFYNGDFIAMCKDYYSTVSSIFGKRCDIIGHIDLVRKFNGDGKLFDEHDAKYLELVYAAVDKLLPLNKPFEINTGAISRGYRSDPYPQSEVIDYIARKGGKLILSSDAHSAQNLCYKFESYEKLANVKEF